MAYINVSNDYEDVIYHKTGSGIQNKLKLSFNDIELENADNYCESITKSGRILKNNNKGFYLNDFPSQDITLILRNVDLSTIVEPVKISLGTLVNNVYEYVPLGTYNIIDKPKTDSDKIIVKLSDNAVKLDFYYDSKPLIEANGGSATKGQIWNDIHEKAGLETNVTDFRGWNEPFGMYDNSIKARQYIAELGEQAGGKVVIDRDGKTNIVYLNDLSVKRIPLSILSSYKKGDKFKISRVVYEDGIIKYEAGTETDDKLYLSATNPYISSQEQIEQILALVNGFEIDSFETGQCYGNPTIDSYDIIEIYDDYQTNEPVIARTLANNDFTYNGLFNATYNTTIKSEDKKENVTLIPSAKSTKRWAKTQIDNVNTTINMITTQVDGNYILTSDSKYLDKKSYYSLIDGKYVLLEKGQDYNVGDIISGNVYEFDDGLIERIKGVETKQSVQELQIDIFSKNIDKTNGDIKEVTTTNGFTFNSDGLNISTNQNEFNTLIDNKGTYYKDGDSIVSQTTKDGTISKDMVLYGKYYYGVDEDLQVSSFTKEDAMFIAETYIDNNGEKGFGHFYNGV